MKDVDDEKIKEEIDEIMKNVNTIVKNIETLYPAQEETPEEDPASTVIPLQERDDLNLSDAG